MYITRKVLLSPPWSKHWTASSTQHYIRDLKISLALSNPGIGEFSRHAFNKNHSEIKSCTKMLNESQKASFFFLHKWVSRREQWAFFSVSLTQPCFIYMYIWTLSQSGHKLLSLFQFPAATDSTHSCDTATYWTDQQQQWLQQHSLI